MVRPGILRGPARRLGPQIVPLLLLRSLLSLPMLFLLNLAHPVRHLLGPASSRLLWKIAFAAVSEAGPPSTPEPVLDAQPSAEFEPSASEVSLTCGQRVPDDSGPSGSSSMDDSGPSGSTPVDEQSQSVVQSQDNVESAVVASGSCSGAKRAFSDPEEEVNSSQSILVDAQDAQHLVKKIRRLFSRKGPSGGATKPAAKPGRHSMPAVVASRPSRSNSI